jgi:hypothetical protein
MVYDNKQRKKERKKERKKDKERRSREQKDGTALHVA